MKRGITVLTALFLVLVGVLILRPSQVSAHWFGGNSSSFASDLAKKLGVGEDKVKSALDSLRSERQKQMRVALGEKLSQMVKDGKITETQKQAILKKHDELQTKRNVERKELENWAKQNGLQNIFPFGGWRPMHGGWMM